jgi:uncharacterized membrane protein YhiD involved in acid resistance
LFSVETQTDSPDQNLLDMVSPPEFTSDFYFFGVVFCCGILIGIVQVISNYKQDLTTLQQAMKHWAAIAIYLLHGLATLVLAWVATEFIEIQRSWLWALTLGFGGPALLRSRFETLPSSKASSAGVVNFSAAVDAVVDFLNAFILSSIAKKRIGEKQDFIQLESSGSLDVNKLVEDTRNHLDRQEQEKFDKLVKGWEESGSGEMVSALIVTFLRAKNKDELLNFLIANKDKYKLS